MDGTGSYLRLFSRRATVKGALYEPSRIKETFIFFFTLRTLERKTLDFQKDRLHVFPPHAGKHVHARLMYIGVTESLDVVFI